MEGSRDYSDPEAVLKLDCAGVAMAAVVDGNMLNDLVRFASSLKYYAKMVKRNFPAQESTTAAQPATVLVDKNFNDPGALLEMDPAGVCIRTKGNHALLNQLVEFANSMEHYADLMHRNVYGGNTGTDEATPAAAAAGSPDAATSPDAAARPDAATSMRASENDERAAVDDDDDGGKKMKARKLAAKRKSDRKVDESDHGKPHGAKEPVRKRSKHDEPLWERLRESSLRHSVGLTRRTISTHSKELGLDGAGHTHSVVRVKGQDKVSHLMLRYDWLDFSLDERQNFHWTLSSTDFHARLVGILDPSKYTQDQLPIFVYGKVGENETTQKLHYVGHYRCVRQTTINNMHEDKKLELEFKYVHFDKTLADKMQDLAT